MRSNTTEVRQRNPGEKCTGCDDERPTGNDEQDNPDDVLLSGTHSSPPDIELVTATPEEDLATIL